MMTLEARLADITTLDVDAIVNAANTALLPGGGVSGAIHRAAGAALAEACRAHAPCPTGEARLTPGFGLKARSVIHAVGPIWRGGGHGEADQLASAYAAALDLARRNGVTSLAFPAISTGIFGYPLAEATAVAVGAVRRAAAEPGPIRTVIFACLEPRTLAAYAREGVPVSRGPARADR